MGQVRAHEVLARSKGAAQEVLSKKAPPIGACRGRVAPAGSRHERAPEALGPVSGLPGPPADPPGPDRRLHLQPDGADAAAGPGDRRRTDRRGAGTWGTSALGTALTSASVRRWRPTPYLESLRTECANLYEARYGPAPGARTTLSTVASSGLPSSESAL